jgi:hypothetical protein
MRTALLIAAALFPVMVGNIPALGVSALLVHLYRRMPPHGEN